MRPGDEGSDRDVSDAALVALVRGGDTSAFSELVSRHHAVLFRTARTILRSADDAQDVTQKAWLQAYQHLGRFAGTSSVRTWLVAIARNSAIDHRRMTLRQRLRQFPPDEEPAASRHFVSRLSSPEDVLLQKERRHRLQQAIAALPSHLRAVLRLWHTEEYSYAEMASRSGVPLGTIKSRIWEARQRVRVSCAEH